MLKSVLTYCSILDICQDIFGCYRNYRLWNKIPCWLILWVLLAVLYFNVLLYFVLSSDSYDDVQPLPEDFPPPPPEIRYPFVWFTEGQQEMRAWDIENSVQTDKQHIVKLYWCTSDKWWDQVKECLNLPINYIYLSVGVNQFHSIQFIPRGQFELLIKAFVSFLINCLNHSIFTA